MRRTICLVSLIAALIVGAYFTGRYVEAASASTYVARVRTSARIARDALLDLVALRAEGIRLGGATYVADYFTENPDLDIDQSDFIAGLVAINAVDATLKANSEAYQIALDKLAD